MYIIFDTETTGLPISWKLPPSQVENWPRVVQLAWQTFDKSGRKTAARCYLIQPNGFQIPKDAKRIHGISTRLALRKGVPVGKALREFLESVDESSVLVAHNMSFDGNVLQAEFHRLGMVRPFRGKSQVCTKESGTEYCALPGPYGFKWPTLPELHFRLFGKTVRETHDAGADVATCSKCFFELKRLGLIRIPKRRTR